MPFDVYYTFCNGIVHLFWARGGHGFLHPVQGLEAVWYETIANGTRFLVGNVYIPPSDTRALSLLDTALSKIDSSTPLLILGDLNCRHLMWEHWHLAHPPRSTAFSMGSALLSICDNHSLVIANDGRYRSF